MSYDDNRIKTTTYLGHPIVQSHSIQQKAREILKHNQRANFSRISFNGQMGSGKTSAILHLTHLLHTIGAEEYGRNYAVNHIDSELLLDPEKYAESIPPVDQIIITDDTSYVTEMMGKFKKAMLKRITTKMRHSEQNGVHVTFNVITIIVTHYTKGHDKFLRDVDFRFITTVTPEEKRSIAEIVGKDMMQKFMWRSYQLEVNGKLAIQLDPRDPFDVLWYKDGQPFRLMLYSSKYGNHYCVFCDPTRIHDYQLHCNICNPEYQGTRLTGEKFLELMYDEIDPKYVNDAVRMLLFNQGKTNYLYRHKFKAYFLGLHLLQKFKVDPDEIGKALSIKQNKPETHDIPHRQLNQSTVLQIEQKAESDAEPYDYESDDE